MAYHAKKSPSKSDMFMTCAGSLTLGAAIPAIHRNIAGHAAQRGTATHFLVETTLRAQKHPSDYAERIIVLIESDSDDPTAEDQTSMLRPGAKTPKTGTVFFIVDEDMVESATIMTDYVRERCEELGVTLDEVELETRTNPLPDRDDTSGTADVTLNGFAKLLLIDFKNGYLYVDATKPQVKSYLLGKAIEADWSHEEYEVAIVQPNSEGHSAKIRSHTYTKKELLAYQKELRAAVQRCDTAADAPGAPEDNGRDYKDVDSDWVGKWLNAGEAGDHCTFCDAKPWCPAHLAMMQEAASVSFNDEPEDLPVPGDEEGLARLLMWKDKFNALFAAAVAAGTRAAQNGFTVPGFKLVEGRTNRKWDPELDEAALAAKLAKRAKVYGLDPKKLWEPPKLKTGPQVEKLVPTKKREAFNDEFLFKPPGALTLAPDHDARSEKDAPEMFGCDWAEESDFG